MQFGDLSVSVFRIGIAAWLGALIGSILSILVVTGYAIVILSEILNIYYSFIFFVFGSYYSYKIFKKNQIMLQLDNDFASRGFNASGPTNTNMGLFKSPRNGPKNQRKPWKDLPDRFLRGGNEDQPEGF